jgi:hypothetical protein
MIKAIPCALLIALSCHCFGQGGQPDKKPRKTGEVEEAEVVIEKSRAITLPEADRNYEKIGNSTTKENPMLRPYQYTDYELKLADLNPKFRILQMPTDAAGDQTGNYVKAGLSNYMGLLGEGYFNSTRSQDYSYGAKAKLLSFGQGPVDRANSSSSEGFLGVHGKYFTSALTASAALEYSARLYHFYGYRPGSVGRDRDDRRDIRHAFITIGVKTSFANADAESDLDYKLDVNVFNLSDNYNAREFEFGTSFTGKYNLSDQLGVGLNADLFLTRVSDSGSVNRNLFRLKPRLLYGNGDNLSVSVGLNIVYQNDTLNSSTALNLLPSVEGQYTLAESFTVFAGFDGDVQRTTLRQFSTENPWLAPNVPLANTIKGREIYAGFKGRVAGDLSFAARLGYAGYKNMYFYVNSRTDTSKFTLAYDPEFTGVINFTGELAYNAADKFRLSAKVDFFNFNPPNQEEAWHRPKFTTTLLGKYNLNGKLSFDTEIYYLGGIAAKNFVTNRKSELEPIVDMNVKAEYAVFDRLSAFLALNNLLNRKYQRFLYYPNRGLTVMLGATYSF